MIDSSLESVERCIGKVFDSRSRILLPSSFYLFRDFYESSYDDKSCWTIYVRENSSFQISIGIS